MLITNKIKKNENNILAQTYLSIYALRSFFIPIPDIPLWMCCICSSSLTDSKSNYAILKLSNLPLLSANWSISLIWGIISLQC